MKTTEIKEIGNVFNNLRVISYAGKNKHNKKLAFCECLLCGAKKNMILTEVRTGKGCVKGVRIQITNTTIDMVVEGLRLAMSGMIFKYF